jgi:aspartyl-tRNA(Asn)/glutamyl-tRNA(Gln) amidotransferase subunit B
MIAANKNPEIIIKEKNLVQINDSGEIEIAIDKVLSQNPKDVAEYLSGKEKVIGFLVGQIMKETKGKANPQSVNQLLKEKLSKMKN